MAVPPARDVSGRVPISRLVATAATPAGSIAWMQIPSDVAVVPHCAPCVNGLGTFQRQCGHHCAGCGSCCAQTVSESSLSVVLSALCPCSWRLSRKVVFGVFHKRFGVALLFCQFDITSAFGLRVKLFLAWFVVVLLVLNANRRSLLKFRKSMSSCGLRFVLAVFTLFVPFWHADRLTVIQFDDVAVGAAKLSPRNLA